MSMIYYLERIFLAVLFLAAGGFFLYKMVTTEPHKLKKEQAFRIDFGSGLPAGASEEVWAVFYASKGNLAGSGLFAAAVLFLLYAGIRQKDVAYFVYLIPAGIMLFHTLKEGTGQVQICSDGIRLKNLFGVQFFGYHELDYAESYNVINSFYKGVSYGYRFVKQGQVVLRMDIRQYPGAEDLEAVFADHIKKSVERCAEEAGLD